MLRNTMWAGQKGLKALTAAVKKMKINLLKNDIKIRYKYTKQPITNWQTQTIGLQGSGKNQMIA